MPSTTPLLLLALSSSLHFHLAYAATAQVFAPPSRGPLVQSANYTSFSNNTLRDSRVVRGRVFDRVIQVWLENTDFETAASTPIFESLAEQGVLLTNYNSVTHPSEPNYIAAVGGDFFGAHDDNMYHIPSNISTVVDLLEDKDISWATYQENMAEDAYYGFNYAAPNYASPSSPSYPYYVRKHNPLVIFDAISQDAQRKNRIRTFNDFANDVVGVSRSPPSVHSVLVHGMFRLLMRACMQVNGTLPQWIFVTPNMVCLLLLPLLPSPPPSFLLLPPPPPSSSPPLPLPPYFSFISSTPFSQVNDAHDTTIDFAASFLEYWLLPLLTDPRVNGPRTLVLLTFDENETFGIQNRVYSVLLGALSCFSFLLFFFSLPIAMTKLP
ncbi:hypothetical protein R3P38DRAFT_3293701 [Favolaschia claudopus]|uniref:Acid phosphatase n=1 Tax=Favolaschia claudopus TaxID=2862362 RepID=A0AAV9ZH48_9AGAR